MIIQLTEDDWWQEFVFWRNHGQKKIAFDYLRVKNDLEYFEMLIALIAKRKYGSQVKPGDLICLGEHEIMWSQVDEDVLHSEKLSKSLRQIFHAVGGSVY
jgi:hypothetical protein